MSRTYSRLPFTDMSSASFSTVAAGGSPNSRISTNGEEGNESMANLSAAEELEEVIDGLSIPEMHKGQWLTLLNALRLLARRIDEANEEK